MGSVARFPKPQAVTLFRQPYSGHLSERIANPLLPQLRSIDAALRLISTKRGATFVSPLELTCNADSCVVAPQGRPELLLAFDEAHLTRAGSDLIVREVLCRRSMACDKDAK